jgi:hypothetical protein
VHLDLHIDLGTQPVAGTLSVAGGAASEFSGYTGLIAALEALRLGDGEQTATKEKENR